MNLSRDPCEQSPEPDVSCHNLQVLSIAGVSYFKQRHSAD